MEERPGLDANVDRTVGVLLQDVHVRVPGVDGRTGETPILEGVTASLREPRTAVLGLNGSGKSTLLRVLNGLMRPSSGRINVHGIDVVASPRRARRAVGFVFTDPTAQLLMPTPLEDVELSLRDELRDPGRRRQRAMDLLEEMGLGHRMHHSVYDLSGGQRQLAALTSVLAVDPSLLVLDEPTTLLDHRNRARFLELLRDLPQQVVFSTHDLALAAAADRVLVVHGGRLVADGGPELVDRYGAWCVDGFPGEGTQNDDGAAGA